MPVVPCVPNTVCTWWHGSVHVCGDVYLCLAGGTCLFVSLELSAYIRDDLDMSTNVHKCVMICTHVDSVYQCVPVLSIFLALSSWPETQEPQAEGLGLTPPPPEPLFAMISPCPCLVPSRTLRPSALPAFLFLFPEPQPVVGDLLGQDP